MKWSKDEMVSMWRFASKYTGPWDEIVDCEYMPYEGDVGLILASPERLELLKSIRDMVPDSPYRDKINEVIAKARGEK